MNTKKLQAAAAILSLRGFIGRSQLAAIDEGCRGEEREYFYDLMIALAATVAAMPATYGQDGKGDRAVAYLHYFVGGCDWYITEKDIGAPGDHMVQRQAFGLCCIHEAELGYVSLPEVFEAGAEIDLHWTPRTIGEIKAKKEAA